MTTAELRQLAERIVRARRLLLAGLVARMREDQSRVLYFEQSFDSEVRAMPLPLRFERHLSARVMDPADRKLRRDGLLSIADQMGEWVL